MGEPKYDCTDCVGYCCSIYDRVDVTKKDLKRLARYFGLSEEKTKKKYTTKVDGIRALKKVEDGIFDQTCIFLDQTTRLCSIYEGRPEACREWPIHSGDRCVYYDILQFERAQQDDPDYVPVVEIRVLIDAEEDGSDRSDESHDSHDSESR